MPSDRETYSTNMLAPPIGVAFEILAIATDEAIDSLNGIKQPPMGKAARIADAKLPTDTRDQTHPCKGQTFPFQGRFISFARYIHNSIVPSVTQCTRKIFLLQE